MNDNGDLFLLLLRPTRAPVLGEAASQGFQGQVQLQGWTWAFHNDEEKKRADADEELYRKKSYALESKRSVDVRKSHASEERDVKLRRLEKDDLTEEERAKKVKEIWDKYEDDVDEVLGNAKKLRVSSEAEFKKEIRRLQEEKEDEQRRDRQRDEVSEAERNKSFEFTFTKRVDISTTQLLNSMKAGDVFPSGVLTMHQRSPNQGMTLVFTIQDVRLLDYSLRVEVSDTMTDMREEWTCEFGSLGYVYKNREGGYQASGAGQAVARAATQGTVRAFTMKNTKLRI